MKGVEGGSEKGGRRGKSPHKGGRRWTGSEEDRSPYEAANCRTDMRKGLSNSVGLDQMS